MVELVDTLDSKSGEHYARAGSSPARGTTEEWLSNERSLFLFKRIDPQFNDSRGFFVAPIEEIPRKSPLRTSKTFKC